MKKSLLISLIILFVLPIQIFAGLDIISDFEVVSGDEWENTYINGPAYLTNFVVTADRFQGSGCIEFKGDYISNWGGAEGGWKLILPSQQSWSNY
ncbi:MAG: hypothetical protein JW827_11420, partial [Spirochaetes bacterium]|nr:hypothetical protein [Spirochaetota bacterium]